MHNQMEFTPKQQSDKKRQEFMMKQKESVMLLRSNESIILEQKQKNIIFTKLPARLVNIIMEMLAPKEVPILRCVCSWFKDYIDSNDNLIAIQVFSLFFPKQVDFFCDYGENDIFLQERAKKNYMLSHNTRSQGKWRQFLKTYEDVRESFLAANYKIFLYQQELIEKQQNNNQQQQSILPSKGNNLNGHSNQHNQKQSGLGLLSDPDNSMDVEGSNTESVAALLGFGVTSSGCDPKDQGGEEEVKFKFTIEEGEDQDQLEQINNNKGILFQFNQKQQNESCDSENINFSSQKNIGNQGQINVDSQKCKTRAQRMSQLSSKYIWSVLKDPPLPILKLRRENIGNYCNTWFQNKLAEVLWEGSRQIGLGLHQGSDEEQPLIVVNNIIRDHKEYFIDEIKQYCEKWPFQKKDILNLRYYFYKNKPAYSYISKQPKKPQMNSFTNFKQASPKPLFISKQNRIMSTMEEQGFNNLLGGNKNALSSSSSTNFGGSHPTQNPVVFNFFEDNKDNNDSTNPSNTSQNYNQSIQTKGMFDDIFQFAHKKPGLALLQFNLFPKYDRLIYRNNQKMISKKIINLNITKEFSKINI